MVVVGKITAFWDMILCSLVYWHFLKGTLGAAGSSGVLANSVMFQKTILMICYVQGYWVSGFCPLSAITNNKFLKLDLFLFFYKKLIPVPVSCS